MTPHSIKTTAERFSIELLANGFYRIDGKASGLVWLLNADGTTRSGNGSVPNEVLAWVKADGIARDIERMQARNALASANGTITEEMRAELGNAYRSRDANPLEPFAVMEGLQGGYLPNTVSHFATLEDARTALVDAIERAAEHLMETIETTDRMQDASDDVTHLGILTRAAAEVPSMDAAELAKGYSIATDEWHLIELAPIDPADFEPEDD